MYRVGDTVAKRKQNQSHKTQRDDTDIATDSEVLRNFITKPKPYVPVVTPPQLHLPTFDQRRFHPDPITRPIAEPRSAARLTIPAHKSARAVSVGGPFRTAVGNSRIGSLPHQVAFQAPKRVAVCVRRKTRREVIFAKNHAGKGSRARRSRNQWSDIKC